MFTGVLIGLVSAVMQSSSYVLSRKFVLRFNSPWKLLIYSYLAEGILGGLVWLSLTPFVSIDYSWKLFAWLIFFTLMACLGGFSFFGALKEIEASRLSSLQGIKLIILTLLNLFFVEKFPNIWQYLAVFLATIAAVGMNFTGGKLKWKGILFLLATVFCYSWTDIGAAEISKLIHSGSKALDGLCGTSMAFAFCGLFPLLVFTREKFEKECFFAAFPYGAMWFSAMILLFISFCFIGVMYGVIIQATRGVISVVMGWLLLKTGLDKSEPVVGASAWIRRAIMAIAMLLAIVLYNYR